MRALRNIAIIAALAFVVAAVPGGGNLAEGILAFFTLAFLALISFAVYLIYKRNQLAMLTLGNRERALLYAALGAIVLMIAGADELLDTGPGTLVWLGVLGLAILAIVRVVAQARSY